MSQSLSDSPVTNTRCTISVFKGRTEQHTDQRHCYQEPHNKLSYAPTRPEHNQQRDTNRVREGLDMCERAER